jgi:hypothetical protein
MRYASGMRCAGTTKRTLLSVAGARSSAVERIRRGGEETIEGVEWRALEEAPAA